MDIRIQERIEEFIKELGVIILVCDGEITEDTKEKYSYENDTITMLPTNAYPNLECYYHILFHELAHWTGHHTRLDRECIYTDKEAQDIDEILEEMVAECTAYGLCNFFNVNIPFDYTGIYLVKLASDIHNKKADALFFLKSACEDSQLIYNYLTRKGGVVDEVFR